MEGLHDRGGGGVGPMVRPSLMTHHPVKGNALGTVKVRVHEICVDITLHMTHMREFTMLELQVKAKVLLDRTKLRLETGALLNVDATRQKVKENRTAQFRLLQEATGDMEKLLELPGSERMSAEQVTLRARAWLLQVPLCPPRTNITNTRTSHSNKCCVSHIHMKRK